ncbi:MAG TPA: hypothetical protein VLJ68_02915 [Chitinophagaceae bacterium]|nr:hypothetical protein [Chitinophagaceae bacterium]
MKSKILLLSILFISFISQAQNNARLKVFIDCSNSWCDMTYLRSEINLIDFLNDNQAADVHVLITEQSTGGGGSQHQLIFFGQNNYKNLHDTLRYNTSSTSTDFERRQELIRYIKLGLAPYIARTSAAKDVLIEFKKAESKGDTKEPRAEPTKDPWNYWVFRLNGSGNISLDENYKDFRYYSNFNANRTTEETKLAFEVYGSTNKSSFEYESSPGVIDQFTVKNHEIGFSHYLIKSINSHWSWGYEVDFNQSTFSNNKGRISWRGGIEYDIFPYKDVSTKLITISYSLDVKRNRYYDTTFFEKTKETLWGHRADANLTFNQKWGSAYVGISYHNYFKDWKYFNLGINLSTDIRITGGLSFNMYAFGGLTHDQLFLPKGGATPQEVLTRQRQLASGYNFYTGFGLTYRFGSKVNNFVNPRFEN